MFFGKNESANWLTFLALPALTICGWFIFTLWTMGMGGWWGPVISVCLLMIFSLRTIRHTQWEVSDLRWLVAPFFVLFIMWYVPWWDYHHQRYDTGGHIIQALTFVGIDDQYFDNYRSPIIPAILGIDLLMSGNNYTAFYAVFALFTCSLWQFQHLSERWTSKNRALICTVVIGLLPVFRYWGQMAMTDVAAAGMWILTLHLLMKSEERPNSKYIAIALGLSAGMTFLSKQTHIYLVGLTGWLFLRDRNLSRCKYFLTGWTFVTLPYILDNLINRENGFDLLFGQTQFAIKSTTGVHDSYTTTIFLTDFFGQISIFLFIASLVGLLILYQNNRRDLISVFVLCSPLLILNAVVLDWGEPRYNTPIFALTVIISAISISKNKDIQLKWRRSGSYGNIFSFFSIFIVIIAGFSHALNLPDASQNALEYNNNLDTWTNFEIQVLDEIAEGETLIAGRATSIYLMTGIDTIRYKPNYLVCDCADDIMLNSILTFSPDYALTTNVGPYFGWEKDFDKQLGHGSIELLDIHIEGWWSAALWRIDNTTYLSPDEFFSNHTGSVTGDLLILGPNESFTVGESNLSIRWIEVTHIRPYQQVMRILAGETGLMKNGCIPGDEICNFSSGEQLTSPENHYTYVWIESKVL